MKTIVNQCVGIDISKLSLMACVAKQDLTGHIYFSDCASFDNTQNGFNQLIKWSRKILLKDVKSLFLMEATGVYYEPLAYFLNKIKVNITVCLPTKAKFFAKSLNLKSKNDVIDARMLSHFGVERKHELWGPPVLIFRQLRETTRLRYALNQQITMLNNRIEAINYSESGSDFIFELNSSLLEIVKTKLKECDKEIERLIASDTELKAKVNRILDIKGVGFISAVIVIAETLGFEHIKSRKQLTSYAGLDIVESQSGTSVRGKTKISKKGNARIRSALYFPAMAAVKYNNPLQEDYVRICQSKVVKKIGIIAIERKLLLLIYSLWKSGEKYDPHRNLTRGVEGVMVAVNG